MSDSYKNHNCFSQITLCCLAERTAIIFLGQLETSCAGSYRLCSLGPADSTRVYTSSVIDALHEQVPVKSVDVMTNTCCTHVDVRYAADLKSFVLLSD